MFCSASSKHFSLSFFFALSFFIIEKESFSSTQDIILRASKLGRMPAHGETGDKRLSIDSRGNDLEHMGRLVIIQSILCKTQKLLKHVSRQKENDGKLLLPEIKALNGLFMFLDSPRNA